MDKSIDVDQVRRFYRFLPWADEALTLVQLRVPAEERKEREKALSALASNEEEFVDLVTANPRDRSEGRDLYVAINPIVGPRKVYWPKDAVTLEGTRWPATPPAMGINSSRVASYRMLGIDIDGPTVKEAKRLFRRIADGAGLKRYMAVQTAKGIHVWVPLIGVDALPPAQVILDHLAGAGDLSDDEKQYLDSSVFQAFHQLRVPGTWHKKDPSNPVAVRIYKTVEGGDNEAFSKAIAEMERSSSPCSRQSIPVKASSFMDADKAQKWFRRSLLKVLRRADGKIHLFRLPPGVGKSRTALDALKDLAATGQRSLYLAPRHVLLEELCGHTGEHGGKMPQFDRAACGDIGPDAERARHLGFMASVCRECGRRRRCGYLRQREEAVAHTILFAPSSHIVTPNFWQEDRPGGDRPLVVLDECLADFIQERHTISQDRVKALLAILDKTHKAADDETRDLLRPYRHRMRVLNDFLSGTKLRANFRDLASEGMRGRVKEWPLKPQPWSMEKAEALRKATKYKLTWTHMATLRSIHEVAIASGTELVVHRTKLQRSDKEVRLLDFYVPHGLEEGRTYILLDATTDPALLRQHFGDRLVEHELPKLVALKGEVTQVMDYLWGVTQIRKQLARPRKTSRKPALLNLIDRIVALHPEASRIGVIGHKGRGSPTIVQQIVEGMDATVAESEHFGNLRGTNRFERCDLLLVIGTHRLPASAIGQRASAFTQSKIDARPAKKKTIRTLRDMDEGAEWSVKNFWPKTDMQWAVHRTFVEGELLQAIGRARIVRRNTPVYILTNELFELPGIKRVFSEDLFPRPDVSEAQRERRASEREEYYRNFSTFVTKLIRNGPVYPKRISDEARKSGLGRFDRETITKPGPGDTASHWKRWVSENMKKLKKASVRGGAEAYNLKTKP